MPDTVTDVQNNGNGYETIGLVLIPIFIVVGVAAIAVYLSDLGSRRLGHFKDYLRLNFRKHSKRNRRHQSSDTPTAEIDSSLTTRPSADLSVDLHAGSVDPDAALKGTRSMADKIDIDVQPLRVLKQAPNGPRRRPSPMYKKRPHLHEIPLRSSSSPKRIQGPRNTQDAQRASRSNGNKVRSASPAVPHSSLSVRKNRRDNRSLEVETSTALELPSNRQSNRMERLPSNQSLASTTSMSMGDHQPLDTPRHDSGASNPNRLDLKMDSSVEYESQEDGYVTFSAASGEGLHPSGQKGLKRRTSVKHRVFSKVLGGIQSRSKPKQKVQTGQSDMSLVRRWSRKSSERAQRRSQSYDDPLVSSASFPTRSSSDVERRRSASGSRDDIEDERDTAPNSFTSSPILSQAELSPSGTKLNYPEPKSRPRLTVKLKCKPEYSFVDLEDEKTMWAAVEIRGDIDIPIYESASPGSSSSLNVAIVLDNSACTSHRCLCNVYELVLHLAHLLDNPKDRLTVFCTAAREHAADEQTAATCQIYPLGPIRLGSVKSCLHPIVEHCDQTLHRATNLGETLATAIQALSCDGLSTRSLKGVNGHVFILSPTPFNCSNIPDRITPLPVHYLNPSVVPWRNKELLSSGWQLTSMPVPYLGWPALNQDDLDSLPNQLRVVIRHARMNSLPDDIRDLSIEVSPATGCAIEEIRGDTKCSILRPGQVVAVILKLRVATVKRKATVLPGQTGMAKQPSTVEELFEELDAILGETSTDLFTVKVRCKDPAGAGQDRLITQQTCSIRRPNCSSLWSLQPTQQMLEEAARVQADVHRLLVSLIANSQSPRVALQALDDLLATMTDGVGCPYFVELAREELEYQAVAMDRLDVGLDPGSSEPITNDSPQLGRFYWEPVTNSSPNSPATVVHHSDQNTPIRNSNSSPSLLRNQSNLPPLSISPPRKQLQLPNGSEMPAADEARKIWQHIRRSSRGQRWLLAKGSSESLELLEKLDETGTLTNIRKEALRNKRSVGADTLRSFATASGGGLVVGGVGLGDGGGFAPWL